MRRELSVAIALVTLGIVLAVTAPRYFAAENLRDMFLVNMPILVVAIGTTLVILAGEIDISVGSAFAVCSVVAGVAAKAGVPIAAIAVGTGVVGAAMGAMNGALVAYAGIPSIVVTLAAMIGLRDGLRWITQGAWVEDLPASFQWLGVSQRAFPVVTGVAVGALVAVVAWTMRNLAAGRAVYATGSDPEAARLAGVRPRRVVFATFVLVGVLAALGAVLNAVRFPIVDPTAGTGLELEVIAAVVVGGTAVTGGRGTLAGTLIGVLLLATVGPALVFLGAAPQWERAIQGAIILSAVAGNGSRRFAKA